ncbi:MAG: hypothetical protein J5I94_29015 [Phaeodactylibacter sp.]|nr:hypothetical protein [Phaeodactylibacter sp.]
MTANRRQLKTYFLPYCLLLMSGILLAQPGRWQWGIGTSVHFSDPGLQVEPAATPEMAPRTGLSLLARYRLNRKANLQWGALRNRINLFWETGMRADMHAYAYDEGRDNISRDYLNLEVPLNLVLISDVRGFPWWRKRAMHGYARLGGSIGAVLPQSIDGMVGEVNETTDIRGLRAALHLSSGLLRKMENGGSSSIGIFARFGLTPVVKGRLSSASIDPPLSFRSAGSLFGMEWSYFFGGREMKGSLPEEPVDMILCPRL